MCFGKVMKTSFFFFFFKIKHVQYRPFILQTNSAYMLFYERIRPDLKSEYDQDQQMGEELEEEVPKFKVDLSKELADVSSILFVQYL